MHYQQDNLAGLNIGQQRMIREQVVTIIFRFEI
jgi:hypothetical protein